jgi:hypothetical protein
MKTTQFEMQAVELRDWNSRLAAYLWEETGNGSLDLIESVRSDWWVRAGGCSWCCTPETLVYLFADKQSKDFFEKEMQHKLKERRNAYLISLKP